LSSTALKGVPIAVAAASIKQKRGRLVMGVMAVNQNPIEI
jgi:hypothetical protein